LAITAEVPAADVDGPLEVGGAGFPDAFGLAELATWIFGAGGEFSAAG